MINDPNFVNVYRALIGPYLPDSGGLRVGVRDEELKERGIFFSNQSFPQSRSPRMVDIGGFHNRKVEGLPVFLAFKSAEFVTNLQDYSEGSRPAIVVAKIPIFYLRDQFITITRTAQYEKDDRVLPIEEIVIRGEDITGECHLQGKLERLRDNEIFLRPSNMEGGRVVEGTVWQIEGYRGGEKWR